MNFRSKIIAAFVLLSAHLCAADFGRFRFALGEIESGNNDRAVGRAGEITRYQIKPELVGRVPSRGARSGDRAYIPEPAAWRIACRILAGRSNEFQRKTGRAPGERELYALWNAPGSFARARYRFNGLSVVVRDRCVRFENLVGRVPSRGESDLSGDRAYIRNYHLKRETTGACGRPPSVWDAG